MHLDLLSISHRGGNVKTLSGIIGGKDKTSSWHLNGFPNGSNIGPLGQQYNVGEKSTVNLYTYIIRHAGT